jgi:hypothetical protein
VSIKETWQHLGQAWGSRNPRNQAEARDYQLYRHLPKAQADPGSYKLRFGYLFWLTITWGAAAFFLCVLIGVNVSAGAASPVNGDYVIGTIACALFALLLGIAGWLLRAEYRSARRRWREFEQACRVVPATVIGKWSQAPTNMDILLDYYVALRYLDEITVRAEVSGKDFDRLSVGQTIPVRYLPTEPTHCALERSSG